MSEILFIALLINIIMFGVIINLVNFNIDSDSDDLVYCIMALLFISCIITPICIICIGCHYGVVVM